MTNEQKALCEKMRAVGAACSALPVDARWSVLAAEGVLGLPLPAEHGGGGHSYVSTALAYEALGAALDDGGLLLAAGAHLFGVAAMIDKVGTSAQKARYLPRLASGEWIATVAATEVESGSDIASARAVVEREGDARLLRGEKRYVTMADRADLFFAVGRDGKDGRGLTALLVPRDALRTRAGDLLQTAGLRSARLAPVSFDGARAGDDGVLGREGAGLAVFQIAMTFERALVLAFRLGAMQTQLTEAVRFARARKVGDTIIAKHQAVAHRIARMKLRLEASRALVLRAAEALDRGERAQEEAALAKWHLAEAAVENALDAFRLRGGEGFLESSGAIATTIDALGGTVHSGTADVLPTIVARWLGL